MNRKDELIVERDRLLWLLTHTAHALTEGARKGLEMSYTKHITHPAMTNPTDEEGLEFAVSYLKHQVEVGVKLLEI